MMQESMTLEQITKSQRDLALLKTQLTVKEKIDEYEMTYKRTYGSREKHKIKVLVQGLKEKLDYFARYKEIFDGIKSCKTQREGLSSQIHSIEKEIRSKYEKLIRDEIDEKTKELKKELECVTSLLKSKSIKTKDCFHCDEYAKIFSRTTCPLCGETIYFSS
jgi:hypothetical protein